MVKPRGLGALVLGYVLLTKAWAVLGVIGATAEGAVGVAPGAGALGAGLETLCAVAMVVVAVAYLAGGIGLVLARTWAAWAVLLAAAAEVIGAVGTVTFLCYPGWTGMPRAVDGASLGGAVRAAAALVFPAAVGYAAWRLQGNVDFWGLGRRRTGADTRGR